jgi:hypothetical protein
MPRDRTWRERQVDPGGTTRIVPWARSSLKGSVLDVNLALADTITCNFLRCCARAKVWLRLDPFEFLFGGKMGCTLPHFG